MMERSKIKSERDAYALIVGISTYQDNEISKLNWTINDAQAIFDLLIDPDKAGFKKENVKFLLDNEATLMNIKDAISGWLFRKADEDSIVIIFFAGHGGVEEDRFTLEEDGLGKYLLPYDTKKDNLSASALSNNEFNKFLRAIRSKRLVVFMDSCYSGGVTEKKARDINIVDPYKKMAEGEGRLVIAASQPNQRSFEDDKLRHGVFTYHLIEALSGAADSDDDGYVKAMDVYDYLSKKVPKTARELAGGLQEPILRGDLKTDIILTSNRQRLKELNEKKIKISKLNDLARQHYDEGDYSEAIVKWQEILKLSPENNNVIERIKESERILKKLGELNNSAQQFYDEGKYRIAITKWQEVLKLDSDNRNAIEGIDKSETNLMDFDDEKKIEIEVLNGLAQQLLVDNRYQKAITKWQEVLKLDAENRKAIEGIEKTKRILINELYRQAQELYDEGKYNEVIAKLQEVLKLDAENRKAIEGIEKAEGILKKIDKLTNQAQELYDEGKYNEVIAKWQEVLKLDAENRKAIEGIEKTKRILIHELNRLAQQLYDEEKYNEAIAKWQEVSTLDAENRKAIEGIEKTEGILIHELNRLAQQLYDEEKYNEAIAKWQEVLKLDAENRKAIEGIEKTEGIFKKIDELNRLAQQLYDEEKYNEAIEKCKEVFKLDPNNPIAKKTESFLFSSKIEAEESLDRINVISFIFLSFFWFNSYRILGFGLLNWAFPGFIVALLLTLLLLFYKKEIERNYYSLVWILFPILILLQDIESLYLTFLLCVILPFVVEIISIKASRKNIKKIENLYMFYWVLCILYLFWLGIKYIYDLIVRWI